MPMKLYCVNKAAISIAQNPVQHNCTKHVEIKKLHKREDWVWSYLHAFCPYYAINSWYSHHGIV